MWINSLIHSTNLAKEANILKERSKKIEQVQTFLFDLASKNSIFDSQFVLTDRRQLERAFTIIEEHLESFFTHAETNHSTQNGQSKQVIAALKSFVQVFLEAKKLKSDSSNSGPFKAKLGECHKMLLSPVPAGDSEMSLAHFIEADTHQDQCELGTSEESFDRVSKIVDDLFYHLQRTSVSNNVFLEHYYGRLETASLAQFEDIIV